MATKPAATKKTAPMKADAKTTAVATRSKGTAITTADPKTLSDWGVPQMTSRDIVIPKILPMQAMSKKVTAGEAKFGEFRDSLTDEVVGDEKRPIEFIPFFMEKCYVVMRKEKGQYKFNRTVPLVAENEGEDFEQTNEGHEEKWYRTQNFYVLFPNEIENGAAIPKLLSFRSSSAKAGNKLATVMFMQNLKAGKTPAAQVMQLSGAKTSNDKGTFIVMDVKTVRESTEAEVAEAFNWVKTIRAGSAKVDHSDLEGEAATGPAAAEPESSEF